VGALHGVDGHLNLVPPPTPTGSGSLVASRNAALLGSFGQNAHCLKNAREADSALRFGGKRSDHAKIGDRQGGRLSDVDIYARRQFVQRLAFSGPKHLRVLRLACADAWRAAPVTTSDGQ
jgi:hypothetical protein